MTVFWDVVPCSLMSDISEVLTASIIKAKLGATSEKTVIFILAAMRA
jgi:hypothetical protein